MYYDSGLGLIIDKYNHGCFGPNTYSISFISWKQVFMVYDLMVRKELPYWTCPLGEISREAAGFILANPPHEFKGKSQR